MGKLILSTPLKENSSVIIQTEINNTKDISVRKICMVHGTAGTRMDSCLMQGYFTKEFPMVNGPAGIQMETRGS